MLKLIEFCHNHHPSEVRMLENSFDVDFRFKQSSDKDIVSC